MGLYSELRAVAVATDFALAGATMAKRVDRSICSSLHVLVLSLYSELRVVAIASEFTLSGATQDISISSQTAEGSYSD